MMRRCPLVVDSLRISQSNEKIAFWLSIVNMVSRVMVVVGVLIRLLASKRSPCRLRHAVSTPR